MEIASLFNELSSPVRLAILGMLRKGDTRFSDIVKEVGLSSPEVSRHLKRLQEANLIDKLVSGGYRLSLFGKTVVRMTSNLPALMDKSEYFLNHDTSMIPIHLLRDFEALAEAKVEPVFAMMGKMFTMLGDTEYFWDTTNQAEGSSTALLEVMDVGDLDFDIRFIVVPHLVDEYIRMAEERNVKLSIRTMEKLDFTVTVSNNIAFFTLADKDGVINRNRYIIGDSPEFIAWCKELYDHYWDRASIA